MGADEREKSDFARYANAEIVSFGAYVVDVGNNNTHTIRAARNEDCLNIKYLYRESFFAFRGLISYFFSFRCYTTLFRAIKAHDTRCTFSLVLCSRSRRC